MIREENTAVMPELAHVADKRLIFQREEEDNAVWNRIRVIPFVSKYDEEETTPQQTNTVGDEPQVCIHCNKYAKLRCSGCKTPFCSTVCQKSAWKVKKCC